eukprot:10124500-Ditylum_brightwellii.AAC.1
MEVCQQPTMRETVKTTSPSHKWLEIYDRIRGHPSQTHTPPPPIQQGEQVGIKTKTRIKSFTIWSLIKTRIFTMKK